MREGKQCRLFQECTRAAIFSRNAVCKPGEFIRWHESKWKKQQQCYVRLSSVLVSKLKQFACNCMTVRVPFATRQVRFLHTDYPTPCFHFDLSKFCWLLSTLFLAATLSKIQSNLLDKINFFSSFNLLPFWKHRDRLERVV